MLQTGRAKKVTIYINEDIRHHLGSLSDAVLTFLLHKGVSGATATRAMAGFGAHRTMHSSKIEALAEHLPIRVEFIDSAETVDALIPELSAMVSDGIIDVQETEVVRVARKETPAAPPRMRKSRAPRD
jgi:PII-like signaling protein